MNTSTPSVALGAAVVVAALLAVVALFQVALACGAPWGAAAYSAGQWHPGDPVLPVHLRVVSATVQPVSYVLVALVILRRAGFSRVWAPLPDSWLPAAVWALVGVWVASCVMNAITPSALERAIWLPVVFVVLAATTTVAVTSR